ncbi:MAG: DUF5054 domain-containing protein [Bacilli bacterium]
MGEVKVVHVVFKTHLDIGFTDLARNVIRQYQENYIPKALQLADLLSKEGGPEQFIWTTGSWLIANYLKTAPSKPRSELENAIRKGSIVWHGLPFTTHTELMNAGLFDYGLSIAQRLDSLYGRTTIAAKMTDVPGHTLAMAPHLAKRGIRYLHIGVNDASTKPHVPDVFLWEGPDGSPMIVNYAGSYGGVSYVEGLDDVLVFSHTGDNNGPPSVDDIRREFERLSARFPSARIMASTMDAFAERLWAYKDQLPVVREEIGDTWIHGAASDPKKVAHFRTLMRLRERWIREGRLMHGSEEWETFSDALLMVPEHTWGVDIKTYLGDFAHYSKTDFRSARARNRVTQNAIPGKYAYLGAFALPESEPAVDEDETGHAVGEDEMDTAAQRTYRFVESSWQEQRGYLQLAVASLPADLRAEAEVSLEQLTPTHAAVTDAEPIVAEQEYPCGEFVVSFAGDGSIQRLTDRHGKAWADGEHRLGVFCYETFGLENYQHWFNHYLVNLRQTHVSADADFGKPGFEYSVPEPEHRLFSPRIGALYLRKHDRADQIVASLIMPDEAVNVYGSPRTLELVYEFATGQRRLAVTLSWFDKDSTRLPEASWFSFTPRVDNPNLWKIEKMGQLLSPLEVVKGGARAIHAVERGVSYHGADGKASIETLDAPVVSMGARRLLQFDNQFAPLEGGIHFNLHNNVWGTNFPAWYEEDAKFRFVLSLA